MSMSQGYLDNSPKVNRELRSWMMGRSFDKQVLQMGIVDWMPYEVSDPH